MEVLNLSHRPKRNPNGITKADKEARKSDDLINRNFKSVEPLQSDFNDNMNFNKNKVTAELINTLKIELVVKGIITTSNLIKENADKTNKLLQELIFSDEVLKEHSENIKENSRN